MIVELPWWATTFVLPVASGLAGAAIWEGFFVRRRQQRELATVLAADLIDGLTYLCQHYYLIKHDREISPEFQCSTMLFESLTPRLGELPPDLVRDLAAWLRQCQEINRVARIPLEQSRPISEVLNYISLMARVGLGTLVTLSEMSNAVVGDKGRTKISALRQAVDEIPLPPKHILQRFDETANND
jgi:hypothetical protein